MKVEQMNKYGHRAMQMWQQSVPWAYQELEDAETFFLELGEEVVTRIESLSASLVAKIPQDVDEAARMGEVVAAQRQAEEFVVREMIYDPVGQMAKNPEHQEVEDLMLDLPGIDSLEDSRWDLMSRAQDRLEDAWEQSTEPRAPMYFPSTAPAGTPLSQMWYTKEHGWNPVLTTGLMASELEELAQLDQLVAIVKAHQAGTLTPEQISQVRSYVANLQEQGLA